MRTKYLSTYRMIGTKVAFYRKMKNMTQEQLANRIGVSRWYIAQIEAPQSKKPFSLDVLLAVAEGLDIDPMLFFVPLPEIRDSE